MNHATAPINAIERALSEERPRFCRDCRKRLDGWRDVASILYDPNGSGPLCVMCSVNRENAVTTNMRWRR